jgi:hypothetical protein
MFIPNTRRRKRAFCTQWSKNMRRIHLEWLPVAVAVLLLAVSVAPSHAQQTRFYDSRGNSIGTAAPQGQGAVRYYDSRGKSLGTSSTNSSGTTTFYDSRGHVTGRASRR